MAKLAALMKKNNELKAQIATIMTENLEQVTKLNERIENLRNMHKEEKKKGIELRNFLVRLQGDMHIPTFDTEDAQASIEDMLVETK